MYDSKSIHANLRSSAEAFAAARREYVLMILDLNYQKDMAEPDWKPWTFGDGECPECGSRNFAPAIHPKHYYRGIACNECYSVWHREDLPVDHSDERKAQGAALLQLTRMGFDEPTAMSLVVRYGGRRVSYHVRMLPAGISQLIY